ncbi:MAG TPA: hypothetical protein VHD35_02125 [Chitinophagaceae bacterium]|nr:hypothetical protein [Chitinophagaceae bacterium]
MKLSFTLPQFITTAFIFSLISIGSCSKEKSSGTDQQQQDASFTSAESDSQGEMAFNEVFDDAMGVNNDVGMAGTGIFGRGESSDGLNRLDSLPPCAIVTIVHASTSNFFPVQITIDFGSSGCIRPADGHSRKGKIIINYNNRLTIPGAVASVTFDNFYIDDTKIEGGASITNTSASNNTQASRQFTVDVTNGKLSTADGNYVEWTSHKTITQTEGLSTPLYPRDDAFQIEGSANGRAQKGNLLVAWQSTITSPLIKNFECRWIVQGTVKVIRASSNANTSWTGYLDYGNGNCDNQATATVNGVTYQISLH